MRQFGQSCTAETTKRLSVINFHDKCMMGRVEFQRAELMCLRGLDFGLESIRSHLRLWRKSVLIYMETVLFGVFFFFWFGFNFLFVFGFCLCCCLFVVLLAGKWSLILSGTYLLRCL